LQKLTSAMSWNNGLTGLLIDDRYQVKKRLGSGGMGTVYSAMDRVLEREVAIKVGRHGASSIEVERFLREARTLASLDHPNIVRVFNLGQLPNERPYMVMELLRGRTFARIVEEGPIKLARIIDRLWEIASALDWIHGHKVIHRDLKLDNLMLVQRADGRETAKLFDFGIAFDRNQGDRRLTRDGSILGTPLYIAPELVESDQVGPRTDVYSFGVVIYQLLAGAPPFEAASPIELLRRKMRADAPPMSRFRRDLPRGVEGIVARALSRDPSSRPASATELVRELARALQEEKPRAVPARRSRRFAIAGSVAFLLAALIGGYAQRISRDADTPAPTEYADPPPHLPQ
jgi:serine/threonine-protein kinase